MDASGHMEGGREGKGYIEGDNEGQAAWRREGE